MLELGKKDRTKLTFRSCLAEGLLEGSFIKQLARKSLSSADHASGLDKVGGGLVPIMKSTLIGWT